MDNNLRSKIIKMVNTTIELNKCAIKNCAKLHKTIEINNKLNKLKQMMMNQPNDKKRDKIIKVIMKNKLIIEYQTCLYNKCFKYMKNNVKAFINIIYTYNKLGKLSLDNYANKLIKHSAKLIKKSSLNQHELKELSYSILNFSSYIKHHYHK